jgi:hypothetical protein
MEKITDILLSEVEDEDGKKYGRIFELRSNGDPEHGITSTDRRIDMLLCGTSGWLQELGFRPANISTVQWDEIVEIKKNKVIIRPPEQARTNNSA